MRTSALVIVLILGAALVAGATSVASAQEGLTPGVPVTGTLSGDTASYTFSASGGQLLLLSLESTDFDARLRLADADGNELAYDDDGGDGSNSLLSFVAQADATYTAVVDGWSLDGTYTLALNATEPVQLEMGSTTSLPADGTAQVLYAVFSGATDDVVNVYATSQGEDDVSLSLVGVDGQEIEYDDDDGPGYNPYLRRVILPSDGLYLVKVDSIMDESLAAAVDLTVEPTERLLITDTPYAVTLNDEGLNTEVFTFEAATSTVYRITVTCELGTGVQMELLGTQAFFNPDFQSSDAVRLSWDWLSDTDGPVRINVHPSFFSEGDNLTFSMEVVS